MVSNDTDTIVLLLRYIGLFVENGLKQLWIHYGTGEKRRMIPLHLLSRKLGNDFCRVLNKEHVLTGDDTVSKIGTKHAALVSNPTRFLSNFGESPALSDSDLQQAEHYLVLVWLVQGANLLQLHLTS